MYEADFCSVHVFILLKSTVHREMKVQYIGNVPPAYQMMGYNNRLRSRGPSLPCTIINNSLPYRTVPYPTVPYRTVPYRTVPYRTVPYRRQTPLPYFLPVQRPGPASSDAGHTGDDTVDVSHGAQWQRRFFRLTSLVLQSSQSL